MPSFRSYNRFTELSTYRKVFTKNQMVKFRSETSRIGSTYEQNTTSAAFNHLRYFPRELSNL